MRFSLPALRASAVFSLLFAFAPPTRALFFTVQQGSQRCFIEEMPGQTLLVATYKNPDFKPFGDSGFTDTSIAIRVIDPSGTQVLSRIGDTEGRVAFHSTVGGEYQLCFSTNNTRWQGASPQKFVRRRVRAATGRHRVPTHHVYLLLLTRARTQRHPLPQFQTAR